MQLIISYEQNMQYCEKLSSIWNALSEERSNQSIDRVELFIKIASGTCNVDQEVLQELLFIEGVNKSRKENRKPHSQLVLLAPCFKLRSILYDACVRCV